MTRHILTLAAVAISTAACARSMEVQSAGAVETAVTPATAASLPEGAELTVRLNETLSSRTTRVGDTFTATVVNPVVAQNGATVVPAGAMVHGRVTGLDPSERVGDPAAIRLDFERLMVDGRSYPLSARVTATELEQRRRATDEDVLKKAGIGAAAGAVLGAVVGDVELDDLLKGGLLGAAAGTVIALGTGDVDPTLPEGSTMRLRTTQQVALR